MAAKDHAGTYRLRTLKIGAIFLRAEELQPQVCEYPQPERSSSASTARQNVLLSDQTVRTTDT